MTPQRLSEVKNMLARIEPARELTFANIATEQAKADLRNSASVAVIRELVNALDSTTTLTKGET